MRPYHSSSTAIYASPCQLVLQVDVVCSVPRQQHRQAGNEYFSVPGHTPVIFSEVGGRTLYRLLARDAGGETEGVLLNETVPAWVVDIVVEKKLPKFIKVRTSFIGEDNNSSDNQFISTGHVLRPASSHVGLQNLQEGETNSQ